MNYVFVVVQYRYYQCDNMYYNNNKTWVFILYDNYDLRSKKKY